MKSILSAGGSARCYKQRLHSLPTEVLFQSDRGSVLPEQSFCCTRKGLRLKSNVTFASFERDWRSFSDRNSILPERVSAQIKRDICLIRTGLPLILRQKLHSPRQQFCLHPPRLFPDPRRTRSNRQTKGSLPIIRQNACSRDGVYLSLP